MKSSKLTGVIVLLVMLAGIGLADSRFRGSRFEKLHMFRLIQAFELFSPRFVLKNRETLGLTENQVESIESEILRFKKFALKHGALIKINELKLVSILSKDPVDRKWVAQMIRKIGRLKTDSFIRYIHHLFDVKEILTAKQINMLIQLKQVPKKSVPKEA